jgi:hypothetical protein
MREFHGGLLVTFALCRMLPLRQFSCTNKAAKRGMWSRLDWPARIPIAGKTGTTGGDVAMAGAGIPG